MLQSIIAGEVKERLMDQSDFMPDREIGFDYTLEYVNFVKGEFLAKRFTQVEDRKGNPGIFGDLLVTNLRIVWLQDKFPRVNLSIGYNVFLKMALVQPEVNLESEHVQIKAFHGDSRYEFFFYRKKSTQGSFDILPKIFNAYDATRGYRELFIRKIISHNGQLILYDREKIIKHYPSVWNLGRSEGKLGRFYFTNIRVVWFSNTNENFNISIPYVRILKIQSKSTNFGDAISIFTSKHFGGLEVGFKIDNIDFKTILQEIKDLWESYRASPFLGIPETISTEGPNNFSSIKKSYFTESELLDTGYNEDQNIKSIYRDETQAATGEVSYV
jgi:Bardet-Biedl syndrome 5 protein